MSVSRCIAWACHVLALVVCLAVAGRSQAALTFTISLHQGGGPTTTIVDNGSGDLNPAMNAISFASIVGDYLIIGNATTNSPGTTNAAIFAGYQVGRLFAANLGNLFITANDIFTAPNGAGDQLQLDSSLAVSSFVGSAPGDITTLLSSSGAVNTGLQTITSPGGTAGPFTNVAPPAFFVRGPSFPLTAESQVNLAPGANVNFNTTTTAIATQAPSVVPEPTSAVVFLATAPLAFFFGWRKKRSRGLA